MSPLNVLSPAPAAALLATRLAVELGGEIRDDR